MSDDISADDLERQIIFMEQELIFKRALLEECRQKLDSEITEHAQTKSAAAKYVNENKELKLQLEVCLTGAQKLEEENRKNRELLVKLQVQLNTCLNERQQLLDGCYENEKENKALKTEMSELKEQLKGHLVFLENFKHRRFKTEALVTEIVNKQEMLNKEQSRLEVICKEGLEFAEKLSEEAKFQVKFIHEAKLSQAKMEKEIIRLMAALSELKAEKVKTQLGKRENCGCLEMWEATQKEMKIRNEQLQEINKRLQEELDFAKEQLEILLKNYQTPSINKVLNNYFFYFVAYQHRLPGPLAGGKGVK